MMILATEITMYLLNILCWQQNPVKRRCSSGEDKTLHWMVVSKKCAVKCLLGMFHDVWWESWWTGDTDQRTLSILAVLAVVSCNYRLTTWNVTHWFSWSLSLACWDCLQYFFDVLSATASKKYSTVRLIIFRV